MINKNNPIEVVVKIIMSSAAEVEASDVVCGWCGVAGVDNVILEDCDGCDLVKYCSDNCRGEHREQHEEECKQRAKELYDNKLFRHPDSSHRGECPICFLPLPLVAEKSIFYSCCSKVICNGCEYANYKSNGGSSCSFCREKYLDDDEEMHERMMKRVQANDPAALCQMGIIKRHTEGDYDGAFEYLTKAAELGDAHAHYQLGMMYWRGDGVEKDEEKEVYHLEKAAIGGDPYARHNLGCIEHKNGNVERAVKHAIIAAKLGYEESMKALWKEFRDGNITKEDLEATLRAHQAAIDATKSPQREAAQAWRRRGAPFG